MKRFTVYANCQGDALAKTLLENEHFMREYQWEMIPYVQTLTADSVGRVREAMSVSDLIIHQPISGNGRPRELSSDDVLQYAKSGATVLSFPSLYLDAYFPHLASIPYHSWVLNMIHDYFILYGYTQGVSPQSMLALMRSETLYPKDMSIDLVEQSLAVLEKRETKHIIDLQVADFIRENYKSHRLFTQLNHPRRALFEFLARRIFSTINMQSAPLLSDRPGYLDTEGATPMYRSTYKNLDLRFEEDFEHYSVINNQKLDTEQVIASFYEYYRSFDRAALLQIVQRKKPFVPQIMSQFLS